MYDIIIIGGGPAGLAAAIHAIRKRLDILLISHNLGGKTRFRLQLPDDVDQHLVITGSELVDQFVNEMCYLDFMRVKAIVKSVSVIDEGYRLYIDQGDSHQKTYETKTVIVATGVSPKQLHIPGESTYWMRGLCYSAITYAQLFIERRAIVIGDSELAFLSAIELALIAQQVTLIAPSRGELDSPLGQRLQALDNVEILEGYQPLQVKGDEYARSLIIDKQGKTQELVTDAIFVELGLIPRSQFVAHLVERDPNGCICIDAFNRTSMSGCFAAGDVTTVHTEQVLIAIGEGAKAALAAHTYLLSR